MRDTKPAVLFYDDFSAGLGKWECGWFPKGPQSITPPVNGAEVAAYSPSQVTLDAAKDGSKYLSLKAAQRTVTDQDGEQYQYVTGCVTTHPTFTFTPPARVEARLWLPGESTIDNWPAFWCDGTGQWPQTGEMDILEGLDGRAAWHFHSPAGGPGGFGALAPRPKRIGWHHFAAEWFPDHVAFEYDGVQVGVISEGVTSAPMYLILTLALSPTISPPLRVPSEMRAKFVRVTRLGA